MRLFTAVLVIAMAGCVTEIPEQTEQFERGPTPKPNSASPARLAELTPAFREIGTVPEECPALAEDVEELRRLVSPDAEATQASITPDVHQVSFSPLITRPTLRVYKLMYKYLEHRRKLGAENATRGDFVEAYGNARSQFYRQCARVYLSRQVYDRPISFERKRLDPGASFSAGSNFSQQAMIRRTNSTRTELGGSFDVKTKDFWVFDEVSLSVEGKVSKTEAITIGKAVTLGENEVEGISGDVCQDWQVLRTEKYLMGYVEEPILSPGLRTEFEVVRGPGVKTINLCTTEPFLFD